MALVLPVVSICGRLGVGWLGDRLGRRQVYAVSFILMTVGMLLFGCVNIAGMWLLVPFVITFSFGWGGNVTIRMAFLREYFGRSSFGTILGSMAGIMMIGHVTGTPLAGWIFDTWGSYQSTWLGFSALTLVGMLLVLTIPPPSSTAQLPDQPTTQHAER